VPDVKIIELETVMAKVVQITVTLDDDNQVNVQAEGSQADSLVLLAGMLELAKTALLSQQPAPQPGPPASKLLLPLGALPRRNGR
jgi:hypothetical protein